MSTPAPQIAPFAGETATPRPRGLLGRRADEARLAAETSLANSQQLLDVAVGLESVRDAISHLLVAVERQVLWAGTAQLDSNGQWSRTFRLPARGLFVVNFGTSQATVATAAPVVGVPTLGAGVHLVPAASAMAVNGVSSVFTIYGAAGTVLGVQAFAHHLDPLVASTSSAVIGGTP